MDHISKQKVLGKIGGYWPDQDPQDILTVLDRYGAESYHQEIARVHLAVLMLSAGQLDK
jgi:hypothetical protein